MRFGVFAWAVLSWNDTQLPIERLRACAHVSAKLSTSCHTICGSKLEKKSIAISYGSTLAMRVTPVVILFRQKHSQLTTETLIRCKVIINRVPCTSTSNMGLLKVLNVDTVLDTLMCWYVTSVRQCTDLIWRKISFVVVDVGGGTNVSTRFNFELSNAI